MVCIQNGVVCPKYFLSLLLKWINLLIFFLMIWSCKSCQLLLNKILQIKNKPVTCVQNSDAVLSPLRRNHRSPLAWPTLQLLLRSLGYCQGLLWHLRSLSSLVFLRGQRLCCFLGELVWVCVCFCFIFPCFFKEDPSVSLFLLRSSMPFF